MPLYIEEIFFVHTSVSSTSSSGSVTRYTPPCRRAKQSLTFLVTPGVTKSRVVQSRALYVSRKVKESMPWIPVSGQAGSGADVEFNRSMALQLQEIFFLNPCPKSSLTYIQPTNPVKPFLRGIQCREWHGGEQDSIV